MQTREPADLNKFYRVAMVDYGAETEFRIYARNMPTPGNGLPVPKQTNWQWDVLMEKFEPNQYGEYEDTLVHDLDEVLAREKHCLNNSISRTKNKIYSLCRGYEWDWFITFTFSPEKVDRYDYSAVTAKLRNFLNYCRKRSDDLMYMVVPEKHKDGAYHFHGLFANVEDVLDLVPASVPDAWNVANFKWGFTKAEKVKDSFRVSQYITKYITKELLYVTKGKKRYWTSRNIKEPEKHYFKVFDGDAEFLADLLTDICKFSKPVETPDGTMHYINMATDKIPAGIMEFLEQHEIS